MCPRVALCHFCEIHGPTLVFCTSIYPLDTPVTSNPDLSKDPCDGCSFQSRGSEGFVCIDEQTGHKYISCSTVPESDRVNVQQACVRSLSCEVCPDGREGIIYFGDDDRGHVMSYCFVLKDSQARGFQRTYSIILVADEKVVLIQNWKKIVSSLELMIEKLKRESNAIFDKEVTSSVDVSKERRSIRLESAIQVAGRGRCAMNTQRSASKARSLSDLTGSDAIFVALHLDFVSLLKKFQNRMIAKELFLESIKNGLKRRSSDKASHLRNLYSILGPNHFKTTAHHTILGHQVIFQIKNISDQSESNESLISDQIVTTLCELIPPEGVRVALDSPKYFEGTYCNLISLCQQAEIPDEIIQSEDHLLIRINIKNNRLDSPTILGPSVSSCIESINSSKPCPKDVPTLLIGLEKVIQDTSFSDECLSVYLDTTKKEWIEKCRMIEREKCRMIEREKCRMTEREKMEINDSQKCFEQDLDVKRIGQILSVNEMDALLVKSWTECFFKHEKNQVTNNFLQSESIEYHFDSSQEQSYSTCN